MSIAADATTHLDVGTLVDIVESEFHEMPGMRLTSAQAQRLWHMSPETCQQVFERLIEKGSMDVDAGGRYGIPRS